MATNVQSASSGEDASRVLRSIRPKQASTASESGRSPSQSLVRTGPGERYRSAAGAAALGQSYVCPFDGATETIRADADGPEDPERGGGDG
jgi:hypothetical protein